MNADCSSVSMGDRPGWRPYIAQELGEHQLPETAAAAGLALYIAL